MRAVVITKHGGPGVLEVQERPDPQIGPGEVRIDVAAAGINFADVMARMGLYPDAPKTPCIVGYEVAGTVLELGEGVEGLTPGQRVVAGTMFGGYASQVVVPASDVVALPDELSFEQGAAIPVNYGTAWAGLIGFGSLRAGERVWGSPRRRSPSAPARRSMERPRPASTRAAKNWASTTRSTTPRAVGSGACRSST
jgi:NADPH:quinone reductase-like Zn-dependent oxidoreductase